MLVRFINPQILFGVKHYELIIVDENGNITLRQNVKFDEGVSDEEMEAFGAEVLQKVKNEQTENIIIDKPDSEEELTD